jgi:cyclopropane fatty-acyl-phospholipid synthase-like methyltransferase
MSRRRASLGRDYFQRLYAADADPWNFATSLYEHQKYEATLAAIGTGHRNALEIGCSIGVFTRRLARRCRHLLAVDIAETALAAARDRNEGQDNIEFRQMALPDELPPSCFDLIVVSEVAYYWTLSDLDRFLDWLRVALTPGGRFVLVHWTGPTDYPLTGDEVHDHVISSTGGLLCPLLGALHPNYRLDVLAKVPHDATATRR